MIVFYCGFASLLFLTAYRQIALTDAQRKPFAPEPQSIGKSTRNMENRLPYYTAGFE